MSAKKTSKKQNLASNLNVDESDRESLFDDKLGEKRLSALYDTPIPKHNCKTRISNDVCYLTINSSNKKSINQTNLESNINRKKKCLVEKLDTLVSNKEIGKSTCFW